jgi:hypothetical protein
VCVISDAGHQCDSHQQLYEVNVTASTGVMMMMMMMMMMMCDDV